MSITIEFSPADIGLIKAQAASHDTSIEEFSHDAVMRAARNAAYLAKLDRGYKQIMEGSCQTHELIEE